MRKRKLARRIVTKPNPKKAEALKKKEEEATRAKQALADIQKGVIDVLGNRFTIF